MKLLADTSALLALAMRDDKHHGAAVQFVRTHPHARFVLTELVIAEVATRVRARACAAPAAALARSLLESKRYELLFVDTALLRGAIERMARFADKRLSLTDCVSFELMERLGLPRDARDRVTAAHALPHVSWRSFDAAHTEPTTTMLKVRIVQTPSGDPTP